MANTVRSVVRNEPSKVTALIIAYNQERFISEAIESVLAQTYANIEIVVADDGSTDGTQEIISRFARENPGKFKLALSPKNTGIAGNFNRGLKLCSGEFIAWLGGDDLWLPDKIEKQIAYMQAHPEVTGCHTDAEVFVSRTGESLGRFSELYGWGAGTLPEGGVELFFDVRIRMLPSTVMIRAEAARGHRFDERLKYANDWLFDIEAFRNGRMGAVNEVLARYRQHGKNANAGEELKTTASEETMIALAIVSVRYPELFPLVRARRSSLYLIEMVKAVEKNDLDRARAFLRMSLREGHKVRGMLLYLGLFLGLHRMLSTIKGSARLRSLARSFVK
jgi:glycosyltransferase involved in cell wall biosynthesis